LPNISLYGRTGSGGGITVLQKFEQLANTENIYFISHILIMTIQWSDLAIFVGACASSVAGLIVATQKSRCSKINCCGGLVGCERSIPNVSGECNDLESQLENVLELPRPSEAIRLPSIALAPRPPYRTP
jgi:hypothetical protein